MNQEFFGIQLSDSIRVALPLVDMERVIQVQAHHLCPLPGVASFWAGVINHEGSLLWVLDSEEFFNLAPSNPSRVRNLTAAIITRQVQGTQRRVALSVKGLNGVISLNNFNYFQSSAFPLSRQFQSLFSASVQFDNEPFLILATESLFSFLSSKIQLGKAIEGLSF